MNTSNVKSILKSKTFWGAVASLLSIVFPHAYPNALAIIGVTDPMQVVNQIVGGLGALYAIYGRMVATHAVTLTGN